MNYTDFVLCTTRLRQFVAVKTQPLQEKYDINRTELDVLYYLNSCEGADTLADICASLGTNKGYLSKSLFRLNEKKMVETMTDRDDRRIKHNRLTEDGKAVTMELIGLWKKLMPDFIRGLSSEQTSQFCGIMQILYDNISSMLENELEAGGEPFAEKG